MITGRVLGLMYDWSDGGICVVSMYRNYMKALVHIIICLVSSRNVLGF